MMPNRVYNYREFVRRYQVNIMKSDSRVVQKSIMNAIVSSITAASLH